MADIKNILLILTDQQRKDALGCYNDDVDFTPNIDSLAKSGILFDNNYVANPVCTPNRVSIFTGRFVKNHGVYANGLITDKASPNLVEYLRKTGFQTASFGKIHFEPYVCDRGDESRESVLFWSDERAELSLPYYGFEKVELTVGHTLPLAHYGEWFHNRGGTDEMLQSAGELELYKDMPTRLHDSVFVAEKTMEFLRESRDKNRPFFAVASFPDPHFPFNPPREYYEKFKDMDVRYPAGEKDDLKDRPLHYRVHADREFFSRETYGAAYDGEEAVTKERIRCTHAMNNLIDDCVGKIIRTLDDENLIEDTLIIYTSDHGELLGDFGLWYKGPFFFDSVLNTPLIFSNPKLSRDNHNQHMMSSIDILPTALDFLGIGLPSFAEGISHKKAITENMRWEREYALTEYRMEKDNNMICYTDRKYKFIYYDNGDRELTDRMNDPDEKRDISGTRPDLVNLYEKKLLQALVETKPYYPEYTGKA